MPAHSRRKLGTVRSAWAKIQKLIRDARNYHRHRLFPATVTEQGRRIRNEKKATCSSHPSAIFLMGPTASGKSGLALHIARYLPVEIISVDSAQVYRHMNIGTAKPDAEALAATPHHLIDLIDPHEHYSAARFCTDALHTMRQITDRGNIPRKEVPKAPRGAS